MSSPEPPLSAELAFTRVYRAHHDAPIAIRELRCLEVLLPERFTGIQPGDLFAGRWRHPLCGFSPQPGGYGYYCHEALIRKKLAENADGSPAWRKQVEDMLSFWKTENTTAKTRAAYPHWVADALPADDLSEVRPAYPLYRFGGTQLDYEKLLSRGVPGLKHEVERAFAGTEGETKILAEALTGTLDLFAAQARWYGDHVRNSLTIDTAERTIIADSLFAIAERAPQTLREAMQMLWLYSLCAGSWNYGRLDMILGPYLVKDLEAGRLDDEAATALLVSLWNLIADAVPHWDGRITVGGIGRPNEKASDHFALLAMEASRRVRRDVPQLTLRFYPGQDSLLMKTALDILGEGITFPMLYNDVVNIPAAAKAMGVSEAQAVDYLPLGCGEYMLWKCGFATPSGAVNLAKCLELALGDGRCPLTGTVLGPRTGDPAGFADFDALWKAYTTQLETAVAALAMQQKIEYDIAGKEAPFLFITLLTDDCLSRKKAALSGGVRFLAGTLETYGNIDTADALTAIRQTVYDGHSVDLPALLKAMAGNWASAEALRQKLLSLPKYGNDDDVADAMAMRVHEHICRFTQRQAAAVGLDHYLVVVINNSMNVPLGRMVGALPDGRSSGVPLANANNPVAGRDRQGVTAFLNSLVKLRADIHAGAVQNMKFSRSLFTANRQKLEMLLNGYFENGGTQAMLTVVNRGDLEAAMREPEKWGHLMVRVGGFSARFVDLTPDVQRHILERTLNE